MSPVHIAEVDPITLQRALEQFGETEDGTTALAFSEFGNSPPSRNQASVEVAS